MPDRRRRAIIPRLITFEQHYLVLRLDLTLRRVQIGAWIVALWRMGFALLTELAASRRIQPLIVYGLILAR